MTKSTPRLPPAALYQAGLCLLIVLAAMLSAATTGAAESRCTRPIADAIPLLERMERAWAGVSDYTAVLLKTERFIDGTVTNERGFIKFRKPDQLYLHVLEGANEGAELLYPKPGTDSVILGRPGGVTGAVAGFLVNVPAIGKLVPHEFNLDDGRLMEGQHHPLPDSTIDGMMKLISRNLRLAAQHREGGVCIHPPEMVDGKPATRVEVLFPRDAGQWHTVTEDETLWTIGGDYGQDRYVILYNNPAMDPEDTLPEGERIFVPRYYAPRAQVWVSESLSLPVKLRMFDHENRVYETYTNVELKVDTGLSDEDFDPVLHGFPAVTTAEESRPEAAGNTR